MHFEILVEDLLGSSMLESILPRVFAEVGRDRGGPPTWRVHSYKGLGRVPKGLRGATDPWKRILLDRPPQILAGYARGGVADFAVVVVVDLDDRDCLEFKRELLSTLPHSHGEAACAVPNRD